MRIDCHVHIAAATPGNGSLSPELLAKPSFRFLAWRFGFVGATVETQERLKQRLLDELEGAAELDAAVFLALDAPYFPDGRRDDRNTHLYVSNEYVMGLARQHRKVLFGASVHPYRPDALAELERCASGGAALVKWLPVSQRINPADPRCFEFYEALAHYGIPLLCHTGAENTLPILDHSVQDPTLLTAAVERGVTVIAAHSGLCYFPPHPDYVKQFMRMATRYERFYGDTAAFCLPFRGSAFAPLLRHKAVREKLIHGSDWPILPFADPLHLGIRASWRLMREPNWLTRDVLIKRELGFDEAYWERAGKVLRIV